MMTRRVEKKIKKILLSHLAISFDVWSTGKTHYLESFSTHPLLTANGFEEPLLEYLQRKKRLHKMRKGVIFSFFVSVFHRGMTSFEALISDNTFVNRAFTKRFGPFFVAFHSYRFNLGVKSALEEQKVID